MLMSLGPGITIAICLSMCTDLVTRNLVLHSQSSSWWWWVCTCSTHVDPHFCIFLHLCTLEVFSTIQTSSTPLHSQTPKYATHMSTISEYLIACLHITHQHTSKYSTLSTHVLQYIAKAFAHLQMHIPSYFIIFQVDYVTDARLMGKKRPEKVQMHVLAQWKYSETHINALGMLMNQMNWCPNVCKGSANILCDMCE